MDEAGCIYGIMFFIAIIFTIIYCLGLAIQCLGIFLFGMNPIEGTVWFWIIPSLFLAIIIVLIYGCMCFRKKKRLNAKCPHNIRGGQIQGLCPICVQICKDENERISDEYRKNWDEKQKAEQLKKEIKMKADGLREIEIKRLATIKLQKEENIRKLGPREFENTVCKMFEKLGYAVQQTPYVNDHGKDAIMCKDGKKLLLECKLYASYQSIGRPHFQKFFAAMIEEEAAQGIFVNTGYFTKPAIEYGEKNNIQLVDFKKLLTLMKEAYPEKSGEKVVSQMCLECGEVVTFSLENREYQKFCVNGHPLVMDDVYEKEPSSNIM